VRIVKINSRWE